MPVPFSLADINEHNQTHWDAMLAAMTPENLALHMRMHHGEFNETSLYCELTMSVGAAASAITAQAQKGGKAKKPDTLNLLLTSWLQKYPEMTADNVLEKLRNHSGTYPIQDVDKETIDFTNSNGLTKSAQISGLKHRISRIKKSLSRIEAIKNMSL